ncbi:TonB-dependent receptor [Biformimicrobium ophioploci]|uniref:TonB-dependent receptor n=1 Tax=Biformimicrobium ophioploci TaxID=3036711 RepID=A0ABQ6LUH8_9GAMM|nr:TonB-dependent receptor [Microbulbifer sp. NKW57]GMG85748.1 TonB-dependent receptor [Microbulbifer sp. NKW57]
MFNRTALFSAISATMMVCLPASALASEERLALEEVVVTAQKREQNLLDVPVSVQALTGSGLEDAGVQDFADLVNVSPSLGLQDNLAPWQKSVYIRGVGTTINSPTVESSVSTVLDGVVLARQGQFFSELADIERVEVLRGPQSTLFGKNAAAGVLNIVTRRPSLDTSDGSVELGYDEYGEERVRATHGAPLSDVVAYRLSANYKNVGESHLENINIDGDSLDGGKGYAVRGKLLWELNDAADALFIADYGRNDGPAGVRVIRSASGLSQQVIQIGASEVMEYGAGNRKVNINDANLVDTEEWGLSGELNWTLDDHTLTAITAYRSWDHDNALDIDSTGLDVPAVSVPGLGTPYFRGAVSGNKLSKQFSQEIRLQSSNDSALQYQLGAFLWTTNYESNTADRRQVCFGGLVNPVGTHCAGLIPTLLPSPPFPPGTVDGIQLAISGGEETEIDTRYYALFGQADYSLTDEWLLTMGLRVQRDNFEYANTALGPVEAGDIPRRVYQGAGEVSYTEWTGKFGTQYMLGDVSNIYGHYSRGYKGPGADIGSNFEAPLEPEFVDAVELGYKSRLMDGRLGINAALFWQDFTDTQVSYFNVEDSEFRATNAGESRQRGLELDMMFAASADLQLNASATYLDAEYLDYETTCYLRDPDPQCAGNGVKSVAGETTPFSPEWKFVAGSRYVKGIPALAADGFLQLNYRWQSETHYDSAQNPSTLQGDYGVVDLSFGIEDQGGRYQVKLFVHNLTDENYVSNLVAFDDATGMAETVVQFVPKAADRYVGGSFRFNF